MYREMLRAPLQQTIVLLWLIGLGHLGVRLLEGNPTWGGVFSAGLGAVVAALLAGRFHRLGLLSLSMVLGLCTWLILIFKVGMTASAGLSFAGVFYALLVWRLSIELLAYPPTLHLVKGLHRDGNPVLVEHRVHWTAFVITVLCIVVAIEQPGILSSPIAPLPTLGIGMAFLWLAGQRYQHRLHSYTLLGIGVVGALLCYTWTLPFYSPQQFVTLQRLRGDHGLGLLFVLLSLSLWAIAWGLTRRVSDTKEFQADFDQSLYRKPLRVVAVLLALIAAAQQVGLAWTDTAHAVGPLPIEVLFLASASLLLANHALDHPSLSLAAILLAVLAVLRAHALWFHNLAAFVLQPGSRTFTDQWLTLALLALGLACLAQNLSRYPRWERLYTWPLRIAAILTYGWVLFGTLMFFALAPLWADACLPGIWLTLVIGLFPLLQPLPEGASIRGSGVALLLSAFVVSVVALSGREQAHSFIALTWAYVLWSLGNFVLPRFNARWPHWAIAPDAWPWFGLLVVSVSLLGRGLDGHMGLWFYPSHQGGYLTAVAVYLFLMLRNSSWAGFPWLAVLTLTCTGLAFNMAWMWPLSPEPSLGLLFVGSVPPTGFMIGNLLWANLLLLAGSLWRRHGQALLGHLGWRDHDLTAPLLFWPSALLHLWLLLTLLDTSLLFFNSPIPNAVHWPSLVLIQGVLTLSFLHVLWLRRDAWHMRAFFFSLLILLHSWLLLWVPLRQSTLLLPWYALQLAVLVWLLLWLRDTLQRYVEEQQAADEKVFARNTMLREIALLLSSVLPWLAALALLEWMLHGFLMLNSIAATGEPQWLTGGGDAAAALLAAGLLMAAGIRQAWQSQQAWWIHGVALVGGAIGVYIRVLWVGLAPVSAGDTAALMTAAYALFILQRVTLSEPTLHLVMVLPLLALLTVPMQLASPNASGTLLTAGVLYLLICRATSQPLPLYMALLASNTSIYLWVPGWANHYHLFQVYIAPAAVSVLFLLHLHRRELKPTVLNGSRLVATSTLYASASLDVFLRAELTIFAMALALSLAGILIGIALRTRAFLYAGVTFLVLNVLGQLLLLFPEQRLGKAIVLLTLGALITGGMIWFNLQREGILQRIRIFRADLETWT